MINIKESDMYMKSILCLCNTYYQLVLAIQLKATIFQNANFDVIASDHSRNMDQVTKKLAGLGYFRNVYFLEDISKKNYGKKTDKLKRLPVMLGVSGSRINPELNKNIYDEFIYYNLQIPTLDIYASIYKMNNNIKVSRFEESITSCFGSSFNEGSFDSVYYSFIYHVRKLAKKRNLTDDIYKFYCYYPKLYVGKAQAVGVPLIEREKINNVIAAIFNIENLSYPQKYIFFASVGDFEGEHEVGEVETAKKIAELVGYDNLLVKLHPRDATGKFEKSGLSVDKNSTIPWEAIQLNYDFSNHVFLTISSTSVFGVNLMLKKRAPVYILYNTVDTSQNTVIQSAVDGVKDILGHKEMVDLSNYKVLESLEDILK